MTILFRHNMVVFIVSMYFIFSLKLIEQFSLISVAQYLSQMGFMFFTVISDQDESFGQGKEIEKSTFAVKPDKILHFFTLDDLKEHFKEFDILETGSLEDQVTHTLYGMKSYRSDI